jgi:hypothetical protein
MDYLICNRQNSEHGVTSRRELEQYAEFFKPGASRA